MKKLIILGLVGILLVTVIGLAVFVIYLDSMVKAGIEAAGPQITGTTVTVEAVRLSLLTGEGRVKGLVIGNPKGYQAPSAFKLGDARVKVNLRSALTDKLIIEEIVVEAPDVTYEAAMAGSNIAKIQEHVGAFGKTIGGSTPAAKPVKVSGSHQKKVQINHLIVRSGRVNASAIGRSVTVPLPDIHLKDLGKGSEGTTVQEAFAQVMGEINKSVLQAVSSSGKALAKGAEAAGETAKNIGSKAGETGSKAVEGVKGLFGK